MVVVNHKGGFLLMRTSTATVYAHYIDNKISPKTLYVGLRAEFKKIYVSTLRRSSAKRRAKFRDRILKSKNETI